MPEHIIDRKPELDSQELLAQMVPPKTFAGVSFSTYVPNPAHPSQQAALHSAQEFAQQVNALQKSRHSFFKKRKKIHGIGLYLDGGFGVGKTHLLASIYDAVHGKKLFGSFVEYTNLIGVLSFPEVIEQLSDYVLLCIDEFELDDPGDTMQMSRLLKELSDRGVSFCSTSNTLPGQLGEDRFAAKDFLREIQQIANIFTSIRVDGPDYRHRDLPTAPEPLSPDELSNVVAAKNPKVTYDSFDDILRYLATVHPSKYKKLLAGVDGVAVSGVHPLAHQADALRFVSFVDRLYDAGIPVYSSGSKIDEIFTPEMLTGGYRKKYLRAISRLLSLTHLGMSLIE